MRKRVCVAHADEALEALGKRAKSVGIEIGDPLFCYLCDKERPPKAQNGCKCLCHEIPGVKHIIPCCGEGL